MTASEPTGASRQEPTDSSVRKELAKTRCNHVRQILDVEDCGDLEELREEIEEAYLELGVVREMLDDN